MTLVTKIHRSNTSTVNSMYSTHVNGYTLCYLSNPLHVDIFKAHALTTLVKCL